MSDYTDSPQPADVWALLIIWIVCALVWWFG